jgi:phospholipid transport system substrate-binding protein
VNARNAGLVLPLSLALLLAPLAARGEAQNPEAVQVVETLHAALLDVMKNADKLGYQGRFERLEPVLGKTFDLDFMAEKSVGRHWQELSPEDQKRFLATFRRFTLANYAGRFDGWSGQHFETVGEDASTHGTLIVKTRLVDPNDEDVQLNYRLRSVDGHWRIIDVYLNGTVSELALRRSENSSLVERGGINSLLTALEARISDLAAGKGSHENS